MLRDTLAEDVTKLSNLLRRDLSHWLTEPECCLERLSLSVSDHFRNGYSDGLNEPKS
jgi:hypothetical protein